MKCPFCGHLHDKVVDSRESKEGEAIRRRRQCIGCSRRFTSYERIDEIPYMVVKKDSRRERFDRQKVLSGLLRACERRPVSMIQLEAIADKAELLAQESPVREVSAESVGESIMTELKTLDKAGVHLWDAELYRVQGNLLLQLGVSRISKAEACFHQAIDAQIP